MKRINIKAIFIDIDWTLYDHKNHRFDLKSIKALNRLHDKGVKVIAVTSRSYYSAFHLGLFDVLNLDGYATSNGGYIVYDDKEIYRYIFPKKTLDKIINISSKYNLAMEFATHNDCFISGDINEYVNDFFKVFNERMPGVRKSVDEDIITITLFAPKKYDEILKSEYPKEIELYRFDSTGVDVSLSHLDKGEAVKRLMDYLHLEKDECMAIGDDLDDKRMFKFVKYSVAMGNAKEEVKASSLYITKPVWRSGVKRALRHFRLIRI